jgi:hypothetical protein
VRMKITSLIFISFSYVSLIRNSACDRVLSLKEASSCRGLFVQDANSFRLAGNIGHLRNISN